MRIELRVNGEPRQFDIGAAQTLLDVLREAKIDEPDAWAPKLKQMLQKVFEEVDDTAFEPLKEALDGASGETALIWRAQPSAASRAMPTCASARVSSARRRSS